MTTSQQSPIRRSCAIRPATTFLAVLFTAAFLQGVVTDLRAQQFTVIHSFNGRDGDGLSSGLTIDRGGNFYGTTYYGGAHGYGEVYRLQLVNGTWVLSILYSFAGGSDGSHPWAGALVFGPDGALYGTTYAGGNGGCGSLNFGCGTVFRLSPPVNFCTTAVCSWTEKVLYRFSGGADGAGPRAGVAFDAAGNLYGTTLGGGLTSPPCGCGVLFQLTRSGMNWTYHPIHAFTGGADGNQPYSGVIVDRAGILYGTTASGGLFGSGTVYQFQSSGSGWTETVLHSFTNGADGETPTADLIFDSAGTIYGVAAHGGQTDSQSDPGAKHGSLPPGGPPVMDPPVSGTAFTLTPTGGGNWTFNVIYTFALADHGGLGGEEPYFALIMDQAGNLYGVATDGGIPPEQDGAVFKLTPGSPQWTYTSLHDFTGGSDGYDPECALVMDASGNLYGTASYTVFEVTP
jgi:uncharacterized repeat protein (TIGR03803 family)